MNVQKLLKVGTVISIFCHETTVTGNSADGYYPCKILFMYDGRATVINLETNKLHSRSVFYIKNVYAWYTKRNWKVLVTDHGNWIESRNSSIGFTVVRPGHILYDTLYGVPLYITEKVHELASKGVIE